MQRITPAEIHAHAQTIARTLKGFAYIADKRQLNGDGELAYYALLAEVDAPTGVIPMQLAVGTTYSAPGKLCISLHSVARDHAGDPVNVYDALPRGTDIASIRVSAGRVEAAARDIERRLLPAAREQWALMLARQADRNDYAARTAQGIEAMRATGATFTKNTHGEGHIYIGEVWGQVAVYGSTLALDLRSLTVEQAVRVIGALKEE